MQNQPAFQAAFPYQEDVLALPVADLDSTYARCSKNFGMVEVQRHDQCVPTLILERGGTRIGLAINDGDASQDGAAVLVSGIHELKEEFIGENKCPT